MRRRLGQHFLRNKTFLRKIVEALDLQSDDVVIEIGAGRGELTEIMQNEKRKVENGVSENTKCRILAIERDKGLAGLLRKKFAADKNVEILEGDALKILPSILRFKFSILHSRKFVCKLVGNIPYYITGKLLRILSELERKPSLCVFTLQKEVAERICSTSGRRKTGNVTSDVPSISNRVQERRMSRKLKNGMNRLAAIVQFWAKPEIIAHIPRSAFNPPPEVDSAILKLKIENLKLKIDADKYYKIVKILFQQPRKTILNNLTSEYRKSVGLAMSKNWLGNKLRAIGVNPNDRPQNLSVEEIIKISRLYDL